MMGGLVLALDLVIPEIAGAIIRDGAVSFWAFRKTDSSVRETGRSGRAVSRIIAGAISGSVESREVVSRIAPGGRPG